MARGFITQVADSVPFDNDTNGFTADNVQEAIEEIQTAVAPLVVTIALTHNGTLSNGDFIGYNNLLSNKEIIIPISGTFTGYTMSNSRSNADFALEFRLGSTGATPFFTRSTDNVKSEDVSIGTPEPVSAGGVFLVKYIDEGTNASDMSIILKFKA